MAGQGGINGTSVFITLVGSVLVYSAVKGNKISVTLRDFLAGKAPATNYDFSAATGLATLGGAAGATSGSAPSVSGSGEAAIDSYLQSLGFTKAGRAGALGNIQVESGFSPTAYNAGEGAIGICQWELGRRTALQAYAKAHGSTETDLNMQLGYMRAELLSSKSPVYLYMRATGDPSSAAAYWDQYYEGSAGTTRQERISNAVSIYAGLS